ncbi:hypothetical protein NKI41_31520 [Mesorhizobium sp. M0601]|uniref:hypothetical protein n=1 Tax=Mesorhizobium sp. M0601 TaxID=2956969 RepID=UPI00333D4645
MIKIAFRGFEAPFHEQSLLREEPLYIVPEEPSATMSARCVLLAIQIRENFDSLDACFHFSITHTIGLAGCIASRNYLVGCDCERWDRAISSRLLKKWLAAGL